MADFYASIGVSTTALATLTRAGFASAGRPGRAFGECVHAFAEGRPQTGGGSLTRPLTGLLHPPDRRGNRA